MRVLLLLLILANVMLFTHFNQGIFSSKMVLDNKEYNANQLKLLVEDDFGSLTKRTINVAGKRLSQTNTSCYKWGNFSATNLPIAQAMLLSFGLQADVNPESVQKQDGRFWVYYPPLASVELAQKKADEIKTLGVDELYIVQDSQWRNAISFGLFTEEAHAITLLGQLKAKGVRNVKKSLRNQSESVASLLVKAVSKEATLQLYKVQPKFIGTSIKAAACSV